MEQQQKAIIDELKAYAMSEYENGGDTFVECYDDSEWVEFVEQCDRHARPYKECMLEMMCVWEDRRRGIKNEIF